jgi:hypothetical protein
MSWLRRRITGIGRTVVPEDQRRDRSGGGIPRGPTAEQLYGGPEAFSGYTPEAARGDPAGQAAARAALGQMGQWAQGTMTGADQAAMQQAQFTGEQASRSALDAIAQQAAMRGTGGGGLDYLARAAAAQSGANMAAQLASQQAQAMQDRQFGATQGLAAMGLGLDTQAMQRGGAIDDFNRWATGASADAAQQAYQNVMARWQAKQDQRQQRMDAIRGFLQTGTSMFRPGGR